MLKGEEGVFLLCARETKRREREHLRFPHAGVGGAVAACSSAGSGIWRESKNLEV